jgi:hypothetical protein
MKPSDVMHPVEQKTKKITDHPGLFKSLHMIDTVGRY